MKPDRVGHDRGLAVAELDLARGRVERREELVLGQGDLAADERVEQRRLAGVRVADDRRRSAIIRRSRPRAAVWRCWRTCSTRSFIFAIRVRMIRRSVSSWLLAGSARADAALGPRQVGPQLGQPRQLVLELGELDLEPALVGLGVEGEDVEDQPAAIDHLDVQQALERLLLARRRARRRR